MGTKKDTDLGYLKNSPIYSRQRYRKGKDKDKRETKKAALFLLNVK